MVTLVAVQAKFFENTKEETCLLLAESFGARRRHVDLVPLTSVEELSRPSGAGGCPSKEPSRSRSRRGSLVRFAEGAHLSWEERNARTGIKRQAGCPLGRLARCVVTNGDVTGDNDFFHRSRAAA